jgi:hypothetical protein
MKMSDTNLRGTGRTTKMLEEVIHCIVHNAYLNGEGKGRKINIIVFAHNFHYAQFLFRYNFLEMIHKMGLLFIGKVYYSKMSFVCRNVEVFFRYTDRPILNFGDIYKQIKLFPWIYSLSEPIYVFEDHCIYENC